MRYFRKNERGFTLIELLIVVVIIGILAAVGVPIYSRYITSARAAEAPTILMALREYAQSYVRAHPSHMFDTDSLLSESASSGTDNWVDEVVGNDNVYFSYSWTGGTNRQLKATALATLCSDCTGEEMIYTFNNDTSGNGTWSVTADSRLEDVMPD